GQDRDRANLLVGRHEKLRFIQEVVGSQEGCLVEVLSVRRLRHHPENTLAIAHDDRAVANLNDGDSVPRGNREQKRRGKLAKTLVESDEINRAISSFRLGVVRE